MLTFGLHYLGTLVDLSLSDHRHFLKFVGLLYERGLIGFTAHCKGVVGAFTVAKKPKLIDGVQRSRQRLVLECRQTNQLFRPSPHTQLGSLASLCELSLPDGESLYLSGADIQDCFYAVHIPELMQRYFCLGGSLGVDEIHAIAGCDLGLDHSLDYHPCFTVLPMGFSWSFFLVQQIHQAAVCRSLHITEQELFRDGFPPPQIKSNCVYSMPYCDNIHSISTNKEVCDQGKSDIVHELARLGFSIHEEEDASLCFNTLGGVVDGDVGEVRMSQKRAWTVIRAFEYVAEHPTSPSTIQRLLGHAMFFSTLNRCGMAVFRRLYDFVEKGGPSRLLNAGEARECRIFAGIVPLLFASIGRSWSTKCIAVMPVQMDMGCAVVLCCKPTLSKLAGGTNAGDTSGCPRSNGYRDSVPWDWIHSQILGRFWGVVMITLMSIMWTTMKIFLRYPNMLCNLVIGRRC